MRTYNDLINKIIRIRSLQEQISFLEDIISQVSEKERLIGYDIWQEDAQKILFDLQDGIDIQNHPKYK